MKNNETITKRNYIQTKYDEFMEPSKVFRRKRKFKKIFGATFRYIFLFGLCFSILFPTIQQILRALRAPGDLSKPNVIWIPDEWSVLNIEIAATVLDYWVALFNTTKLSFVSMILQLVSTSLAGYAFSRLRFKGSNILFFGVLLTIIIPPQALSLSQYLYFYRLGFIGSRFSIYLMNAFGMGIRSGIFIFIFRQFFRGLPIELEESAQIDGAGVFKTFWSVMLPNARGAIVTVSLFAFVWAWNDSYFVSLLSASGEKGEFPILTLQLMNVVEALPQTLFYKGITGMLGPDVTDDPIFVSLISNVAALLMMIPLLIGYLFVQKSFVESIERTGIVG